MSAARRRYSGLVRALDLIHGKQRSLEKFKILDVIARVPYQAWEHMDSIAATHVHEGLGSGDR